MCRWDVLSCEFVLGMLILYMVALFLVLASKSGVHIGGVFIIIIWYS